MKLDKRQVICVSLGIILALAVTFVEKQDTVLTKGNGLERNTYGQGETQQEILVEGLLAKKSAFGCQDWRTPVYKGAGGRCNSYGGRRIIRSNCRR